MRSGPLSSPCHCRLTPHGCRLIAITGGPGAGKTAVLELARKQFCEHVVVLPEAASIIFGGGFPREDDEVARRAAQRAIFAVQRQLERLAIERGSAAVALCDRGTLDGLAYWPGAADAFFRELETTREAEQSRYAAVVHLRTPPAAAGYDHSNPVRIESALEALALDARIDAAWEGHPKRTVVAAQHDFLGKAMAALDAIRAHVPDCCLTPPAG